MILTKRALPSGVIRKTPCAPLGGFEERNMTFRDLRSFVDELDARNDLLRLDRPVKPQLEAPAVMRTLEEKDGPAVLFTNLGAQKIAVVGNLLSSKRRLELVFGGEGDYRSVVLTRLKGRLPPLWVEDVPVQQVVHRKGIDCSSLLPIL
jgi:UbiD family decarboxylase